MPETLSRAALNRALLARQHLLARTDRPVPEVVDHLVGMQAQNPLDPYVALWSRVDGFTPGALADLVEAREAVRLWTLRGTIHLHTAADALATRPLFDALVGRLLRSTPFWRATEGLDRDALVEAGRGWLAEAPRTGPELRELAAAFAPDGDAAAMAQVVRHVLPVVQVAPRGVWGRSRAVTLALLDRYVGAPVADHADPQALVLRYLAAFGPASVADIAAWSRLTGVRALVEPLRDRLVTFVHEDSGRELFDLPDAPRPGPDVEPPPARFLPEYDNVLLGHADRSRIVGEVPPEDVLLAEGFPRWVLVDGRLGGTWRTVDEAGTTRMVVRPFGSWTRAQQRAVLDEAGALLAMTHAGREVDVEVGVGR